MPEPRHMKASDVYRERQPPFAKPLTFDEAFPQIEDVEVEVEEIGKGVSSLVPRMTYTKTMLGEYIDCSNPACYNGGFRMGAVLREMIRTRQTEREDTKTCQGYEGSAKGRRRYAGCWNAFKIKVSITYRQTSGGET